MKLIKYDYNSNIQLSNHFKAREWRCKCKEKHDFYIADELPLLFETIMEKIGAVRGDVASGYHCEKHDRNIGGEQEAQRIKVMHVILNLLIRKDKLLIVKLLF